MFDLFKRDAEPDRRPWAERLKAGLVLSRERLNRPLSELFGRRTLSDETLEELETALLEADVGVPATTHLLAQLADRAKRADGDADGRTLLKAVLTELLLPLEQPLIVGPERPFVVMIAGVNGTGKTTSIGTLAKFLQGQGYSVMLAAGDTFRAAAREQLEIWGERNGVPVVAQHGGDPAAVMFDAIAAARARGIGVVLADSAGRRPPRGHVRRDRRRACPRHRRGPCRYRRPPADAAQLDGRVEEDSARAGEGAGGCPARDAAGARRQHRPEHPDPSRGL